MNEPSKAWCDLPAETPAVPFPELRPGLVLGGKYHLLRSLGIGGMGQVWTARNSATGADVAIKVLLPERAASHDALERFRREAHATAQLTHRGIIRVFDLLELDPDQGSLLMVMELLRGRTLAQHLHQRERLGIEETLDIVLPILSALEHAHGGGVVHRDLKPENIFLAIEPDGQMMPKLLDFGISKMRRPLVDAITAEGELVGTPCYMSPEQARGKSNVDARSDIFSVGILLYEMLSGRNPFVGDGLHAVVMAILDEDPPPIEDIPAALWAVVARALRKNREERFASAAELGTALRLAVPTYASQAGPRVGSFSSVPPTTRSAAKTVSRLTPAKRLGVAGAIAASALLLLVVGLTSPRASNEAAAAAAPRQVARGPRVELAIDHDVLAPAFADDTSETRQGRAAPPLPAPIRPATDVAAPLPAAPPPTPLPAPTPPRPHRVQLVRDPGF